MPCSLRIPLRARARVRAFAVLVTTIAAATAMALPAPAYASPGATATRTDDASPSREATASGDAASSAKGSDTDGAATDTDAKASKGSDVASGKDAVPASDFEQERLDPKIFDDGEGKKGAKPSSRPSTGGALGRLLFGLLFVLALIYGVHRMLRSYAKSRLPGMAGGSVDAIEVLSTTPLAANRTLHLVRVGDDVVLIGATESSITRLGTLDAREMASAAGNRGDTGFQQALHTSLAGGAGTAAQPDTFVQRLIANLQMMTAR